MPPKSANNDEAMEEPTFTNPHFLAAYNSEEQVQALEEKEKDEMEAIHIKYLNLKQPILAKRDAKIMEGNASKNEDGDATNFWKTALFHHAAFSRHVLLEKEMPVFDNFCEFRVERPKSNPRSYKLIFRFEKNDWFENNELIREVIVDADNESEVVLHKIKWKSGKKLSSEPHVHGESCSNKKRKLETDDDADHDHEHGHEESGFFDWIESENQDLDELFLDDFYENAVRYYADVLHDEEFDSESEEGNDDEADSE